MRAAAVGFRGVKEAEVAIHLDLRRDEVVFCALLNAHMVEARHVTGLATPDFTRFPTPMTGSGTGPLPVGVQLRDVGTAVVTDRRVVFHGGRGKREWAYAKLTGLIHDTSVPFSLMQVSNRKSASGLLLAPADAASFRFNLTLAIADAAGHRAGFIAHLDGVIAAHKHRMPAPPALARPDQAPMRALVTPSRFILTAVIGVLLLCGAFLAVPDAPAERESAGTPQTSSPTVKQPVPAPASPTASPVPVRSTSRPTVAPTLGKNATKSPTSSPTPRRTTASPTPKKVSLCGASANPYGYNFCGGSRIDDPKPDVCSYFDCIDNFWNGKGYMMQCQDGTVSMSGGRPGSCSYHGGNRRAVLQ